MNLKRLLFMVKVEGLSGFPYLMPGKRYLATSLGAPQEGDFIVFRDQNGKDRFLVKKVFAKKGERYFASSTFPKLEKRANFYSVLREQVEGRLFGIAESV